MKRMAQQSAIGVRTLQPANSESRFSEPLNPAVPGLPTVGDLRLKRFQGCNSLGRQGPSARRAENVGDIIGTRNSWPRVGAKVNNCAPRAALGGDWLVAFHIVPLR